MSEAVTNVEIEDVLSSIRRLVAQGDKLRSPVETKENDVAAVVQPSRFVLTPALRVAEDPDTAKAAAAESEAYVTEPDALQLKPLILTPADVMQEQLLHDRMSETERASLEATIAELEAAVTSQADEWEPDGSETVSTTDFADVFAAMRNDVVEHAEVLLSDPVVKLYPHRDEPIFRHAVVENNADDVDTDYGDELRQSDDDGTPIPDDLDETLAAYIAGGSRMEREEIRQMVVEVVRQELQGDLGERITRNIRKLVRAEIHRAMSSNLTD